MRSLGSSTRDWLGAHMSIAGGLARALDREREQGRLLRQVAEAASTEPTASNTP